MRLHRHPCDSPLGCWAMVGRVSCLLLPKVREWRTIRAMVCSSAMGSTMESAVPLSANHFIEQQLDERLVALESHFSAHALSFRGPLVSGVDDIVRASVEERSLEQGTDVERLVVVLTTNGGYIEVVQRIVDTLRNHYQVVDFIVPNSAFSAGTVLVMSGDAIHMDYYSRLGPIDPQAERPDGRLVPALGYLERYNALISKAQNGTITTAEVQLLIDGFDQAELYQYEHARELSISLLKQWLVSYKFKTWTNTETRGISVTDQMREERAEEIARQLSDTQKWHSHGHGISRKVLDRENGTSGSSSYYW